MYLRVPGFKIYTSPSPTAAAVWSYRNFPKFLDRQVWVNSADPDQTAPRLLLEVQSD